MSEDKAITTGAPVATNDKQAAELTQSRPTPGGEWKARKSLDVFIVEKDKEDIWLRFEEDANFLVRRLNAADAMEFENKRLRAALESIASGEADSDSRNPGEAFADIRDVARRALET